MKAVVVCIPLFLMLTFGSDASPAAGTDNQVKLLMRRYEQVEDQLARSVHYVRKTESDGGTTIEQAWFNGAHDLIKVAVERTGSSGRELTDYVAPHFFGDEPMFILVRKETPLPDGGTQVDESRQYFNKDAVLIRELRKSGRFKPGESTDTQHVPNVVEADGDTAVGDHEKNAQTQDAITRTSQALLRPHGGDARRAILVRTTGAS